jgi:hypothetical protein
MISSPPPPPPHGVHQQHQQQVLEELVVLSPAQQQQVIWNQLVSKFQQSGQEGEATTLALISNNDNSNDQTDAGVINKKEFRSWPSYDQVMTDMQSADYNHILTCPHDFNVTSSAAKPAPAAAAAAAGGPCPKTLCPHGAVACCQMELFEFPTSGNNTNNTTKFSKPYTGLLTPGTTVPYGLIRLSSAMKPPQTEAKTKLARALLYVAGSKLRTAQLFPCAALKLFRGHEEEEEEKQDQEPKDTTITTTQEEEKGDSDNKEDGEDGNLKENTIQQGQGQVLPPKPKQQQKKHIPSGNLLLGGSKLGQRESNYFAHCICTTMTEQMPTMIRPLVRKFWTYSDYPLSLGLSDFCYHAYNGSIPEPQDWNFPYALLFRPNTALQQKAHAHAHAPPTPSTGTTTTTSSADAAFDGFLDQVLHIEPGTVLFDVYACPDPMSVADPTSQQHVLQRIGRITTTTRMLPSGPADGMFFRHQLKEDDYTLRPGWKQALKQKVTMNQGQTTGTIGTLVGWKLFEQQIQQGRFVDFEKLSLQQLSLQPTSTKSN